MNLITSTICKHLPFKIVFIYLLGLTNVGLTQGNEVNDSLVIRNYSSSNYMASPVNYAGVTLQNNVILIANDRGVLKYNGSEWELIPILNDSRVTSLLLGDSLIYVGGDDEFGYLKKNADQKYNYYSLRNQIDDTVKLNSVYLIVQVKNNIYFQSYENIIRWDGTSATKIPLADSHIFNVDDKLIASQYEGGLFLIEKDSIISINKEFTFDDDAAFDILSIGQPDVYIICTSENGIFTFNLTNYAVKPWKTEASKLFIKEEYYNAVEWLDSLYAATTWDGGIVIFNKKGEVKKFIDKKDGIFGKYLRELFVDNRNKLWITSDVGISEIYWPSYDTLSKITIQIESIKLDNKLYLNRTIIDSLISENTNIQISFAALGFNQDEVLYSYKLNGLDKNWSVWNSDNTKEYTQLKGGNYEFSVKAKTLNGLESNIATLKLKTLTPWFKTYWAYLLYTLAMFGVITLIIWLNTLRLKSMNKRLELIVTARTDELTIANESLNIKNQELDHFVYRSSHDLIAPLKSLKGLINIAKTDSPQQHQLEYLKHMEKSVLKLEDFINSVIEFTTNAYTLTQHVEIRINDIIDDIALELKYFEQAEKVELKRNIDLPIIKTDPKRLKIILSNLISNGVKYHNFEQENPYIEVNSYQKNGKSIIEVKDNGQGIKPELVDNIFDMFFRASDKSEGSGLGLYIVKDTVAKINAELKVNSTYGKGTIFTLILHN